MQAPGRVHRAQKRLKMCLIGWAVRLRCHGLHAHEGLAGNNGDCHPVLFCQRPDPLQLLLGVVADLLLPDILQLRVLQPVPLHLLQRVFIVSADPICDRAKLHDDFSSGTRTIFTSFGDAEQRDANASAPLDSGRTEVMIGARSIFRSVTNRIPSFISSRY